MRNMHRFTHRRAANTFRSRVINCGDKGRDMTPRRTHVQRTASCIHDDARIPPDSCRIFNPTANVTCISKQSRHVLPFFFCSFSFLLFFFSPFCHPFFHRKTVRYFMLLTAPILMYRFLRYAISLSRYYFMYEIITYMQTIILFFNIR